jgi:lysophospholipase
MRAESWKAKGSNSLCSAATCASMLHSVIEDFAMQLRAGSHLVVVGSQHELLMEQDRYRTQFWAAFDAFVPGTPLY